MQKIQSISVNPSELQIDLAECSYEGNVIYLPKPSDVTLENYDQLRQALLKAGAKYKRNTFVFPNEAKPYIDRLMGGESVNIQKEFQFFATPHRLAERLVMMAEIEEGHTILEPSAGQGRLIEAINIFQDQNSQKITVVDYYELMDINRAVLEKKVDIGHVEANCKGHDFLSLQENPKPYKLYDRIVANPPFTKNQDIDHILRMYECLQPGGVLVSIASNSWRMGSQKKQTAFKEFLDNNDSYIEDVDAGEFKESGTNIATCIIKINK